jgi:predicted nucleotidyltransferase
MIDVSLAHLTLVKKILSRYVPDLTVWVFGSRVRGKVKKYSDLDLVLMTDNPLSLEKMTALQDAFSESDLPWRVDVVDWSRLDKSFQKVISERHEVLWTN